MLSVLCKDKCDHFFDKFLENFFTDADAEFFASKGLNYLRLPMNYRHFEDDMDPRVLKPNCFKHVDRVVDLCAKHNIYTTLDLHALPGGQNPDWHSDNTTNHAAFWDHKDFQDRVIWLWQELAKTLQIQPLGRRLQPYQRTLRPPPPPSPSLLRPHREIDPRSRPRPHLVARQQHVSMEWKFFDHVLPNCVYALHDYTMMGFPKGDTFTGSSDQKSKLERQFLRKADFMNQHSTPIWNGEFGPVYANPLLDADHEEVNAARYACLEAQLAIYDKYKIHWSIWLYKDIGVQGMLHLDPESKYMKTIASFVEKKRKLQLDAWGRYPSAEVEGLIDSLVEWIDRNAPTSKEQYPTPWVTERQVTRIVNQLWVSKCLSDEFAEQFRGMSMEELEECAAAFRFENCLQREGLNKALEAHADVEVFGIDWVRPVGKGGGGKDTLELD